MGLRLPTIVDAGLSTPDTGVRTRSHSSLAHCAELLLDVARAQGVSVAVIEEVQTVLSSAMGASIAVFDGTPVQGLLEELLGVSTSTQLIDPKAIGPAGVYDGLSSGAAVHPPGTLSDALVTEVLGDAVNAAASGPPSRVMDGEQLRCDMTNRNRARAARARTYRVVNGWAALAGAALRRSSTAQCVVESTELLARMNYTRFWARMRFTAGEESVDTNA